MLVKSIRLSSHFDWKSIITDIENDNLEIFVELENGYTYIFVVGTPKNIEYLMDKDKTNYFGPGCPFLIVKKLTKDIIEEAVKAYAADKEDGYWIKLYHFAADIDNIDKTIFDKLEVEERGLNELNNS